MKVLKKIFFILCLLIFIYVFCALFNYLPDSLTPKVLFKNQYQELIHTLLTDSLSQSPTAKISKRLYDSLNPSNTNIPQSTSESQQQDSDNQKPATAVDRAKAAAQDYENKINQEKQVLDNL